MAKREGPPADATGEQLAKYWRKATNDIKFDAQESAERICPRCGSTNPCGGADVCGQCSKSLKNAKRDGNSQRFNSKFY